MADDGNNDTTFTDGGLVFQGQTASYDAANADTSGNTYSDGGYFLYERVDSSTGSPVRSLNANNGWVNASTSGLETGTTYFISNDGSNPGSADITFTVRNMAFDASFDSDSVDNAGTTGVDFTVESSNRQETFDVYVTSDDLSDDELVDIFDDNFDGTDVDVDGDDETDDDDGIQITVDNGEETSEANFSDIDGGSYNFTLDVTDTTAESSASIDVNDIGAGEAEFGNPNVEVPQGDVAEINISLSGAAAGGSGTLVIGTLDDDGYQANISFTDTDDDGEVTVEFNTYTAGSDSLGTVVSAAGEDDVTFDSTDNQTDVTAMLAQGEYTISVSTSSSVSTTTESPQDLGTLFIAERSTDSMQLWTAPGAAELDADEEDGVEESDIASLIEDGLVTQDDTITSGDYVIHQVTATGLTGVVDSEGSLTNALQSGALEVTVEQTNPVQNRDPKVINVTDSGSAVTLVEGDGAYYIAVDTGDSALNVSRNGNQVDLADGDEFEATFTVADDRLLGSSEEDDEQSVNATFEVESEDITLDNDPVQVEAAADQMITGEANSAPGTELTVRVRSTGETQPRFFNTQTVTVQADGTYNASFDFSDQAEGDEFSVTVRKGGTQVASADGEVVGAAATTEAATTEAATTEASTTEATTTEAQTTEAQTTEAQTSEPPATTAEPTSTSTPGFGAVLAVIALIGAALLAVRRDN
ncbi:BGTF surface domain-containing protein [Halobaculum marinum]|uniref:BGTF surface domain-containing protein n=1 Tax=Halobaculum marinum TaxID=3031996 RepID=UPI0023E402A4|nr:BGTF surface domain-containing protein [Halobaculum sp. DT55]